MKIATVNVRGLSAKDKRLAFFHWAREIKIDVICLQETFCTLQNKDNIDKDQTGYVLHSLSDSTHSKGVAILFREGLAFELINSHSDQFGRRLLVNIKYENEEFCIANIYAPNDDQDRLQFLKEFSLG